MVRDEGHKKSDGSTGNPVDRPAAALTVERVGPSEFGTVARMLAVAYSDFRYRSGPCQRLPRDWMMLRFFSNSI